MRRTRFTLFMLTMLLSGCATLQNENAPKVKLINIQPEEMGLFEQHYRVELRVINRSPEPLDVNGISFSLELNGRDFADGVGNQEVSIPGLSSAKVQAELSSSLFGIFNQVVDITSGEKNRFHYRISGVLYAQGSTFGVPFNSEDEIVLTQSDGSIAPDPGTFSDEIPGTDPPD